MNDIIITRKAIKEIAERVYNNPDAYTFQDDGYMLKDLEIAIHECLVTAVDWIVSDFEGYAFGSQPASITFRFRERRYCDANGCEMPVRTDNDIWCYRHGEIEDKRQAEAESAMIAQFDVNEKLGF